MSPLPDASVARAIAEDFAKEDIASLTRFTTGNHHYVYDVRTASKRAFVLRIALPDQVKHFQGALYWQERLLPQGIPVAKILAHDFSMKIHPLPYLILERLAGKDLGEVYKKLSREALARLAGEIAGMQKKVNSLPEAKGFGYATSYDEPLELDWGRKLKAGYQRSRQRIAKHKIFGADVLDQLERQHEALQHYFSRVRPTPFLHDTTTKNVIIDKGKLSGIVDVDSLCFGDPLFVLALTRMAFLSQQWDMYYIDCWKSHLSLNAAQERALDHYTAACCVDFMSEVGEEFNGNKMPVTAKYKKRLETVLKQLLPSTS